MIDEMRIDELIEVMEEVYDRKSQAKAINKDAALLLKGWAEGAELDIADVKEVYGSYEKYRNGKLKWGTDDDSDVAQLLVQVMDKVVTPEKK